MEHKIVSVRFRINTNEYDSSYYYYKTFFLVEDGDLVIAPTSDGYRIGRVCAYDIHPDIPVSGYLVQRIDIDHYKRVLNREKELSMYKDWMDQRIRQSKDLEIYEHYAHKDEKFAEIFNLYRKLLEEDD